MDLATHVPRRQVKILSLLPRAVILTSIAIVVFFISLLTAGTRLLEVERNLESSVAEDMSWTVLQAQIEFHRFHGVLTRYVNGYPDAGREDLQLRYDILGSRLSLMMEGQPRRYLEKAGIYDTLRESVHTYSIIEPILAGLKPGDRHRESQILRTLEPLSLSIRDLANDSLMAGRKWKAEQRIQHRTHTVETLLYMFGTLVSGFALTVLLIRGRQEIASAREAARRDREMTHVYRTLVSIVSHQFRTPLAVIDSSAQRLKRRAGSIEADEVATRADYIRQATNGLLMLMDTILDAARLDTGEIHFRPRSSDLRSVITMLCNRSSDAHENSVIDADVRSLPPVVICDPVLIEQALSNVLENAIKYSDRETVIHVKAWEDAGVVFISVKDEGIGIPHDELELIFKQFFRGRSTQEFPGAGIGLSFARQIARLHHGEIEVASEEGGGSVFTLWFPHESEARETSVVRWRTWV